MIEVKLLVQYWVIVYDGNVDNDLPKKVKLRWFTTLSRLTLNHVLNFHIALQRSNSNPNTQLIEKHFYLDIWSAKFFLYFSFMKREKQDDLPKQVAIPPAQQEMTFVVNIL